MRALTSAPGPTHRPLAHTVGRVQLVYPRLSIDLERDSFVVWVRWVSGELLLTRNSVLGPTIVYRRDLAAPVFLRANHLRVAEVLRAAARGPARLDVQLVIHGSIAHAPYAALYLVRGEQASESIGAAELPGTPLLQVQPSTPADRWHVAGQANLRVMLELEGERRHLTILRD